MTVQIGDLLIGNGQQPFIIAEISGNHDGSLSRALEIVNEAKSSGASAVKLQTYLPETLTIDIQNNDFLIDDQTSLWKGHYLYDLYRKAYTPWDWHREIFDEAKRLDLICFSTAFDESSVDFLEDLDVPAYKISSFENSHLPLIRKVAATGKPLIISTGLATLEEIDETVRTARDCGCTDLVLLKCTSSYPASASNANLLTMQALKERFDCEVGLSDHSKGIGVSIGAVALGATVIEKHLTLAKDDSGVDAGFSMTPEEFSQLVYECNAASVAVGTVRYGPTDEELSSLKFRRSIYALKDIEAGELLTRENIGIIRPGFGVHPRYYSTLLGRLSIRDVKRGDRITADFLL